MLIFPLFEDTLYRAGTLVSSQLPQYFRSQSVVQPRSQRRWFENSAVGPIIDDEFFELFRA